MNLLDAASARVVMKKAGANEYAGPCPSCQGRDRFRVWPDRGSRGTGTYWCRQCGRRGDLIQFFIDFDGMGFKQAAAAAGVDLGPGKKPPAGSKIFTPGPEAGPQPVAAPHTRAVEFPPAAWCEKAGALVDHAAAALEQNTNAAAWLAGRGIPFEAARQYRLGWFEGEKGKPAAWRPREAWGLSTEINDKTGKPKRLWIPRGIVIPHIIDGRVVAVKIRRPMKDYATARPDTIMEKKYIALPGSYTGFMVCGTGRKAAVIVEAELDAICCAHASGDLAAAIAVKTSAAGPDTLASDVLSGCLRVMVALDYDVAGTSGSGRWLDQYPAVRWPVPCGKDPGEAFADGVDLRAWVWAGLPPALTVGRSLADVMKGGGGRNKKEVLQKEIDALALWIDNPEAAPLDQRKARVGELMEKMAALEAMA